MEGAQFEGVHMQGYLLKRFRGGKWDRRWFLTNNYYLLCCKRQPVISRKNSSGGDAQRKNTVDANNGKRKSVFAQALAQAGFSTDSEETDTSKGQHTGEWSLQQQLASAGVSFATHNFTQNSQVTILLP
jgi:hypothetical protein